jgi:hypothetical protein
MIVAALLRYPMFDVALVARHVHED